MNQENLSESEKGLTSKKIKAIKKIIANIQKESSDGDYIYRGEPKNYPKVCSKLYREYADEKEGQGTNEGDGDKRNVLMLNMESIQQQNIDEAKQYIPHTRKASEIEILTELQHYGGSTNLIDFTKDHLIALFFACSGETDKNGRVILLKEEGGKKYRVEEPQGSQNRIIAQKSVFASSLKGFIDIDKDKMIAIEKELKKHVLEYLKKYHGISTLTIYNDLHGFITDYKLHEDARKALRLSLAEHKKGMEASGNDKKKEFYEQAIKHYKEAIRLNPNFAAAYCKRGDVYLILGKLELAYEDYDKAIELMPNYAAAYNSHGVLHSELRKPLAIALRDFDKAIELMPNFADAYNNRGNTYLKLRKYRHALKDFNKAIELDPNFAAAYINCGEVYRGLGDNVFASKGKEKATPNYKKAIENYDEAIELELNDALAYFTRGMIHFILGHFPEAKEDLEFASKNKFDVRETLKPWSSSDLEFAADNNFDVPAAFRKTFTSVAAFEKKYKVKIPQDIRDILEPPQKTRPQKTGITLDEINALLEPPQKTRPQKTPPKPPRFQA